MSQFCKLRRLVATFFRANPPHSLKFPLRQVPAIW
ncbi:hypothetical protein SNOG_12551 [Parastagonospora nodorum SN15]|uniref:Uncharacterized protein n=1 Tax=Phaeosphaeria nodorum (strain SN15 / ATCC MYA-4574 / FGSC 10173) TaxID=321614 RepID=Q0U6R3_PHANO|nr:hypothetical protein SNOG_12551 [Parastagonospora nodorum SN15]EAT79849.1 hypothetical protein SNOG_12551 [Parastagonospora nodorum SN15]